MQSVLKVFGPNKHGFKGLNETLKVLKYHLNALYRNKGFAALKGLKPDRKSFVRLKGLRHIKRAEARLKKLCQIKRASPH